MLASPKFVFRVERDPAGIAAGRAYALNDLELASRLSFFIWSSIPDEELLALAEARRLRDPKTLARQIERMIADPKSQALVTNFAGQWLQHPQPAQRDARQERLPKFRPHAAAGIRARVGAVRRQHHPREAQRSGIADGRLHVRERAAGAALRNSQHLRQPLPASLGPR